MQITQESVIYSFPHAAKWHLQTSQVQWSLSTLICTLYVEAMTRQIPHHIQMTPTFKQEVGKEI